MGCPDFWDTLLLILQSINDCLTQTSFDPSPDYQTGPIKLLSMFIGNKFYQDKIRQLMKLYIDDIKNERKVRVLKDRSINTDFLTK